MKKVTHGQRFFIIHNESFFAKMSERLQKETGEKKKFIQYQWVIPVYVYSINQVFDGSETFDICPTSIEELKKGASWRWRRSIEYNEIGKTLFKTEKDALKVYEQKFSQNQKIIFKENRHLRYLEEQKTDLI